MTLLRQLSELWLDLPTFAVYADELVHLSAHLLADQPLWPGRSAFLRQVADLLSRQIYSLANHPKRSAYTALMVSSLDRVFFYFYLSRQFNPDLCLSALTAPGSTRKCDLGQHLRVK